MQGYMRPFLCLCSATRSTSGATKGKGGVVMSMWFLVGIESSDGMEELTQCGTTTSSPGLTGEVTQGSVWGKSTRQEMRRSCRFITIGHKYTRSCLYVTCQHYITGVFDVLNRHIGMPFDSHKDIHTLTYNTYLSVSLAHTLYIWGFQSKWPAGL